MLVITNRPRASCSSDFEITHVLVPLLFFCPYKCFTCAQGLLYFALLPHVLYSLLRAIIIIIVIDCKNKFFHCEDSVTGAEVDLWPGCHGYLLPFTTFVNLPICFMAFTLQVLTSWYLILYGVRNNVYLFIFLCRLLLVNCMDLWCWFLHWLQFYCSAWNHLVTLW